MGAMREFKLRLAAALVLCMTWSCGPAPHVGDPLGTGVPPIVGTVEMGALYSVAATLGEVGNGATVSLIDTTTNVSMSSTISSPQGVFSLNFPNSFAPNALAPDYTTIFGYVDKSLIADRDPLAAITYNSTTKSYTYTDTTSPQVLLMSPTIITAGSTVNLTGQNYTTTLAGNTVSFAGTNGTGA